MLSQKYNLYMSSHEDHFLVFKLLGEKDIGAPPTEPSNLFVFPLQVKPKAAPVCKGLTPPLDPSDPFADDDRERREVENLAKKFESKYVSVMF